MATENATLAQRLVEAWNTHDPERVLALLTEDHVYEDVTFGAVNRGPAETRQFFAGAFAAFPDIHFAPTAAVASAERGAVESTMTGTQAACATAMTSPSGGRACRSAT